MGRTVFIFGLIVAALFPLIAAIGFGAHYALGCSGGGSSGPVGGCHLFGLEMNFPANLGTPAFVASFIAVPLGILISIVGLLTMIVSGLRRRRNEDRSFGKNK
jgi:hypothetical protein